MPHPSILHIDTGRKFRGGQRQVRLLIRELNKISLDQVLACPQNSRLVAECDHVNLILLSNQSLFRKFFTGPLRRTVKQRKINIIHAHDSEAHSLGVILKRKYPRLKLLVTRRVTFPPSSATSVRHKYLNPVDHYIAISEAVGESLKKIGVPENKIDVIHSGIDLSAVTASVKETAGYSEISNKYRHIVVSAGALTGEKDFDTAVEAFARILERLDGVALFIFGEGPMRSRLEKKISSIGVSGIYLMGHQEPLAPIFKAADLFLLTSRSEGLNSAAIEAAACGLPQVVSDIGGLPEVVENEINGLLCRPGQPEEFAAAAIRILGDEKLRRKMSEKAVEKARLFDISMAVPRYLEIYNRLLVS